MVCVHTNGQDTKSFTRQDTIKLLTELIKADNMVTSSHTGWSGSASKQYYRFTFLLTLTNNEDLINIIKSNTGCARFYAYMGLYHNKYENIKEIEDLLINDSTALITLSGCVVEVIALNVAIYKLRKWYWEPQTLQLLSNWEKNKEIKHEDFIFISN